MEQFYDDNVSEALRRLAEEGFPAAKAEREIRVPVFSLGGANHFAAYSSG